MLLYKKKQNRHLLENFESEFETFSHKIEH
jgi:hypothetical protein